MKQEKDHLLKSIVPLVLALFILLGLVAAAALAPLAVPLLIGGAIVVIYLIVAPLKPTR